MKKRVSIVFVIALLIISLNGKLFALYGDKSGYPYKDKIFDVYVSAKVGPSISPTYKEAKPLDLILPTKMLSQSFFGVALGANVFDFRVETETMYLYQWVDYIADSTLFNTAELNTAYFPEKGQQVIKNYIGINAYYDIKIFSDIIYPYVGAGFGKGKAKTLFFDVDKQPNGLGEQYEGSSSVTVMNFMAGLEYATKIVPASFSVEYRYTRSSAYQVIPSNDGRQYIVDETTIPAGYVSPNAKDINSTFHSVVFSVKYFLY